MSRSGLILGYGLDGDWGGKQTVKRQLSGPGREDDSTLGQGSGKGQNGDTDRGAKRSVD